MTPESGIQRQVDNQGHDITRHQGILDAFHKDIAGLRTQVNNLSPGMERQEDITITLHQDVEKNISALHQGIAKQEATLTAYQEEVKNEIKELRQGLAVLEPRIEQFDNLSNGMSRQELVMASFQKNVMKELDEVGHDLRNLQSRLVERPRAEIGPLLHDPFIGLLSGLGGPDEAEQYQLASVAFGLRRKKGAEFNTMNTEAVSIAISSEANETRWRMCVSVNERIVVRGDKH